jgi:hypothetical protein
MTRNALLYPSPDDVDFAEIAGRLAQINLYCGAGQKPVSVAQHILITCDALSDSSVMPWALLADCWKARLGDMQDHLLDLVIGQAQGGLSEQGEQTIRAELQAMKYRHTEALHEAAGLPDVPPRYEQIIQYAGMVAMATERRDFICQRDYPWPPRLGAYTPLRKVYRLRAAKDVADDLHARFKTNLPSLAGRATVREPAIGKV